MQYSNVGCDFGIASVAEPLISSLILQSNLNPNLNLNYLFTHKKFCFKTSVGLINTRSYNNITSGAIKIGFTTNAEKKFIWNFLLGINKSSASQTYNGIYIYKGGLLCAETNFLFNPLKSKNHLLGININVFNYTIIQTFSYRLPNYSDISISLKLSYYFKKAHND